MLTAADGAAPAVIGRITYDPPTADTHGGLVLTLDRFGDDGTFLPETVEDVDEALALVDAKLSTAMTTSIQALIDGFAAAREDARRAREARDADDARRATEAVARGRRDSPPTLEPANACWECGELIQRHDGSICPNCGQEVIR